jgi:hypothetical protein
VVDARAPQRFTGRLRVCDLVGLLVSCLLVVVAFSPVVFGGRTLSTASETAGTNGQAPFPGQPRPNASVDIRPDKGASAWALEPWAEVTHRAYANGELPLWNPYQATGSPHAGNLQSAVFDPLLLAVNLHPTPLVWDFSIIGAFVLGAAAAYGFGRVLGLGVVPAVVTSSAFSLSGYFFLQSNVGFSRSYVYLPLLFLLVELVLRSRRLWPVLGLGVAIAGNLCVGMPEPSFLVLGSTAAYAVARLVQERRRVALRTSVARLGGAGVLGGMLAAPLLLLFVQYESLSFNAHAPELARGSETLPKWMLLNWLVPYYQAPGYSVTVKSWFGAAVVVSALAALSGRSETRRLHSWFFVALGAVVLIKVYGFALLDWVGRLPVFELVVYPTFAPPIASFAFAVLAGNGVQVVRSGDLVVRRFVWLLAGAMVVFLVFVRTGDRWSTVTSASLHWALRVWGGGAFFAGVAVAAVLAGAWLGRRWGALLLACAVIAELFVLAPFSIYPLRADPYRTPDWMPFVRTALGSETYGRVFGLDAKLYPNTAGALGLQDVRALDALYPERYIRYVRTFIAPDAFDRFTGEESPLLFRDNPMFDALSPRAILSHRNLAGATLRLTGRDADTRVYANIGAYPRAWLVHDVHVVEGEDRAFRFLQERSRRVGRAFVVDAFDPRREAVVEHGGTTADTPLGPLEGDGRCAGERRDGVVVDHYSANSVSLRSDAACRALLVLPDTYFPGWRATVDGRETPVYAVDGLFRGVVVPKGMSRVEFRYEPRAFRIGVGLAVAGLAAFAILAIVPGLHRLRGRAVPDAKRHAGGAGGRE